MKTFDRGTPNQYHARLFGEVAERSKALPC